MNFETKCNKKYLRIEQLHYQLLQRTHLDFTLTCVGGGRLTRPQVLTKTVQTYYLVLN